MFAFPVDLAMLAPNDGQDRVLKSTKRLTLHIDETD